MSLAFLRAWREGRGRDDRARRYVVALTVEPPTDSVVSLAAIADHDADHARWELRYARRAAGLLVSERDALDDSTSSEVAAALAIARNSDPGIAADRREIADRQFNDRLSAYRTAWRDRSSALSTSERLGAVLLRFAGAAAPRPQDLQFARDTMAALLSECNAALRKAFGEATLPTELR
jgi:hypothetical protein